MSAVRELAVIGAGPAGAAAAALLARRGHDVVLLERAAFPRDKLCGEFLSPDALAVLDGLGLSGTHELRAAPPIRRLRLTASLGGAFEAPLEATARGLSRLSLDALLARCAAGSGAELRERARVRAVSSRDDALHLRLHPGSELESLAARAVVDATGRTGLAAPAPGEREERRAFVGFKRHFEAGRAAAELDGFVELHAFPGGYVGLNRVETGAANLCLLVRSSVLRQRGDVEALLAWAGRRNPRLGRRLEALAPLGPRWLSTAGMRFRGTGPGAGPSFEAGDAAGMIAPACGDGLGMALRSAELVAQHAPGALAGRSREALAAYRRAWNGEFRRRLVLGRALQLALLRPAGAATLAFAGARLPAVVEWFVRGTRDWERGLAAERGSGPGAP